MQSDQLKRREFITSLGGAAFCAMECFANSRVNQFEIEVRIQH